MTEAVAHPPEPRRNAAPADAPRFSCDPALNRFMDGGEGLIPVGCASLLFGEDETRKNIVATRFLEESAANEGARL